MFLKSHSPDACCIKDTSVLKSPDSAGTMAVTNFHYITRMSSGFKVYILEGQPHLRSEDRFRHVASDRIRVIPAHPLKRKHGSEPGWTLEERRERALSKSQANARRASESHVPESPTSTWSPRASPTDIIPSPVHCTPVMDEPLALIKKAHREPGKSEGQSQVSALTHIQSRPSVITCVSSLKSVRRPDDCGSHPTVVTQRGYDNVDEHFQRSLGVNYPRGSSRQLSISLSVDDHFAKALGEKWLQIKASSVPCNFSSSASSSSSSSPPSSPGFIHSPDYGKSPK